MQQYRRSGMESLCASLIPGVARQWAVGATITACTTHPARHSSKMCVLHLYMRAQVLWVTTSLHVFVLAGPVRVRQTFTSQGS
jgi:hypothetical protein